MTLSRRVGCGQVIGESDSIDGEKKCKRIFRLFRPGVQPLDGTTDTDRGIGFAKFFRRGAAQRELSWCTGPCVPKAPTSLPNAVTRTIRAAPLDGACSSGAAQRELSWCTGQLDQGPDVVTERRNQDNPRCAAREVNGLRVR
jgi:hypothetical protein